MKTIFKILINNKLHLILVVLYVCFASPKIFSQNISKIQGQSTHIAKQNQLKKDSLNVKKKKGNIVPVPVIITDQNLGYGGVLALGYVHNRKNTTRKDTPPTISGIVGGYTSTGTWLAALAHSESFKNDQYRYLGLLAYANVNLDFYQIGSIDLSQNPVSFNMKGWGTLQRLLFRIGNSDFFIGPQYAYGQVETTINSTDKNHPLIGDILDRFDKNSVFSSIGLLAQIDSRDNTISPNKGLYSGFEIDYDATWLGSSQNFEKFDIYGYAYVPINKWLYSIYHFDYQFVEGDIPFYMKPYLQLRGVPVMKYQGKQTMLLEAQFRGYFYKNWALVAFGGMGKAFDSFSEWNNDKLVVNYGTGFRFDFKKAFGIRVGADFAWTQDDFGWYISIGTGL